MSNFLQIKENGNIIVIRINRPSKLNALNLEILNEFVNVLDKLNTDSTRVLIITGNGEKSFSAGADIDYMSKIGSKEAENFALLGHEVFNKINSLEIPVIAAVNGYALGGGCELALSCDIRFSTPEAQFGQPEVKIGICPGWGGTQRLVKIIGVAKAKDLVLTGRRISAQEAFSMGLVNKIISKENLMFETMEYAKMIANNSSFAIGKSKMLLNKADDMNLDTGLKLEIYSWSLCFSTKERKERMNAFLEKSKTRP